MFDSPQLDSPHAELRGHSVPCDELDKRHKFDPIDPIDVPRKRGLQQQQQRRFSNKDQAQAQSKQM